MTMMLIKRKQSGKGTQWNLDVDIGKDQNIGKSQRIKIFTSNKIRAIHGDIEYMI